VRTSRVQYTSPASTTATVFIILRVSKAYRSNARVAIVLLILIRYQCPNVKSSCFRAIPNQSSGFPSHLPLALAVLLVLHHCSQHPSLASCDHPPLSVRAFSCRCSLPHGFLLLISPSNCLCNPCKPSTNTKSMSISPCRPRSYKPYRAQDKTGFSRTACFDAIDNSCNVAR